MPEFTPERLAEIQRGATDVMQELWALLKEANTSHGETVAVTALLNVASQLVATLDARTPGAGARWRRGFEEGFAYAAAVLADDPA